MQWSPTYPVECHVTHVLEHIVVGMSKDVYITVSLAPFWTQMLQHMLCVSRVASDSLLDLFIQ